VDVKSLKVYVTPQFVQEFLELFDSEESVERDYLKNILHKLYAKVRYAFSLIPLFLTQNY
jgi:serine/threonine-protein phosphatase 2A regulatory subunit B'